MAGCYSLLKHKVVRARSGGSCAAKYVSTVIRYWRVSALVRDVYWTGSFVSESYGLAVNRSRRRGVMQVAGCGLLMAMCSTTCCPHICESQLTAHLHAFIQAGFAKKALISAGRPWCGSAAWAGQGYGLGLQRNWVAVSEKSKWAVSGSNQRVAWKHWPSARECAGSKLF